MPLSASDEIRAAIAASGGALRFDQFMELALYGDSGFYVGVGSAGRRGDFITSPEVGPLFGAVLSRWLDATWDELGNPDVFTIVEGGAGPGTLARSVGAAGPRCLSVATYVAVEISAAQRARHPDWVVSRATMPSVAGAGVVVANELLDNLPIRLFVMDGGWREAFVIERSDGTFAEILRTCGPSQPSILPASAPHGARAPVQERASHWVHDALSSLERGRVMVIDYASATTSVLAHRPWRSWLRTYREHQRGVHYLTEPGLQDITSEVALDQLFARVGRPAALRTQGQFLQRWGIAELVEEGRVAWHDHSARPTLDAMTMRSRVREAEALSDPGGLGAFVVVEFDVV